MSIETEQANLRNVRDWEAERIRRADAYAAVLDNINKAIAALPMGDTSARHMAQNLGYNAQAARGSLRRVLDEPNPFINQGERA